MIFNNSYSIYTINFIKILDFYLIHCPVKNLSGMGISLLDYGWTQPWKNPYYLNKQLKQASSNPNFLYSCANREALYETLRDNNLLNSFSENDGLYEIAVFCDNKKNQFMSLFFHIRNSFAHGRFKIMIHDSETYYLFEDGVFRGENFTINSRIILLEDTLLRWIQIIMNGETVFSDRN